MKTTAKILALLVACLAAGTTTQAQTTVNFRLSDAGSGQSLLSWNVTGEMLTPSGQQIDPGFTNLGAIYPEPIFSTNSSFVNLSTLTNFSFSDGGSLINVSSNTPLAVDGVTVGTLPSNYGRGYGGGEILTLDLSSNAYAYYDPILHTSTLPATGGNYIAYSPGSDSVIIPLDFTNFVTGTYSFSPTDSNGPLFPSGFTSMLTIVPAPEPSALMLAGLGGLSLPALLRRRK